MTRAAAAMATPPPEGAEMCLGIPGRIVEIEPESDVLMGKIDFGGVKRRVCLEHVRDARVGDYVLVHVGFALTRIDEAEAQRVFELLAQLGESESAGDPRAEGTLS